MFLQLCFRIKSITRCGSKSLVNCWISIHSYMIYFSRNEYLPVACWMRNLIQVFPDPGKEASAVAGPAGLLNAGMVQTWIRLWCTRGRLTTSVIMDLLRRSSADLSTLLDTTTMKRTKYEDSTTAHAQMARRRKGQLRIHLSLQVICTLQNRCPKHVLKFWCHKRSLSKDSIQKGIQLQ